MSLLMLACSSGLPIGSIDDTAVDATTNDASIANDTTFMNDTRPANDATSANDAVSTYDVAADTATHNADSGRDAANDVRTDAGASVDAGSAAVCCAGDCCETMGVTAAMCVAEFNVCTSACRCRVTACQDGLTPCRNACCRNTSTQFSAGASDATLLYELNAWSMSAAAYGNTHAVVYHRYATTAAAVHAEYRERRGNAWSAPEIVGASAYYPHLAIYQGAPFVVYVEIPRNGLRTLRLAERNAAAGTWSNRSIATLANVSSETEPFVTTLPNGEAAIAYNAEGRLFFARGDLSALSFSMLPLTLGISCSILSPRIVVSRDASVAIAFRCSGVNQGRIFYARQDTNWQVEEVAGTTGAGLSAATSDDGTAFVGYYESTSSDERIVIAHRTPDGVWRRRIVATQTRNVGSTSAFSSMLALPTGVAFAYRQDVGPMTLWFTQTQGGIWSVPTMVDSGAHSTGTGNNIGISIGSDQIPHLTYVKAATIQHAIRN